MYRFTFAPVWPRISGGYTPLGGENFCRVSPGERFGTINTRRFLISPLVTPGMSKSASMLGSKTRIRPVGSAGRVV